MSLPTAFYARSGGMLHPTAFTRGPWDDRFQHGGPPSALVAGALERFEGDFFLARVTVELLRPVPLQPLRLQLRPERLGRSVQRLEAWLEADGKPVLHARGLRIARAELSPSEPLPLEAWTPPGQLPPYTFTFFRTDVAYHRAIDLRLAHGAWGRTPVGFWARPRVPLVEGDDLSPTEALLILADAQSGMGVPRDPRSHTFLNPDLTVYLQREPAPVPEPDAPAGWFGFDIRSWAGVQGSGLCQSAVRDAEGEVARSAQSVVVRER